MRPLTPDCLPPKSKRRRSKNKKFRKISKYSVVVFKLTEKCYFHVAVVPRQPQPLCKCVPQNAKKCRLSRYVFTRLDISFPIYFIIYWATSRSFLFLVYLFTRDFVHCVHSHHLHHLQRAYTFYFVSFHFASIQFGRFVRFLKVY